MKPAFALLIASFASSASAGHAYDLCCCATKKTPKDKFECSDDPGGKVISDYGGRYKWSASESGEKFKWTGVHGARAEGHYFHATGRGSGLGNNYDLKIGSEEIGPPCKKYQASKQCFNLGKYSRFDFDGNERNDPPSGWNPDPASSQTHAPWAYPPSYHPPPIHV